VLLGKAAVKPVLPAPPTTPPAPQPVTTATQVTLQPLQAQVPARLVLQASTRTCQVSRHANPVSQEPLATKRLPPRVPIVLLEPLLLPADNPAVKLVQQALFKPTRVRPIVRIANPVQPVTSPELMLAQLVCQALSLTVQDNSVAPHVTKALIKTVPDKSLVKPVAQVPLPTALAAVLVLCARRALIKMGWDKTPVLSVKWVHLQHFLVAPNVPSVHPVLFRI